MDQGVQMHLSFLLLLQLLLQLEFQPGESQLHHCAYFCHYFTHLLDIFFFLLFSGFIGGQLWYSGDVAGEHWQQTSKHCKGWKTMASGSCMAQGYQYRW